MPTLEKSGCGEQVMLVAFAFMLFALLGPRPAAGAGAAPGGMVAMTNKVKIDVHEQQERLRIEREKCAELAERTPNVTGSCPVFWDEILCWPQTPANRTVATFCPNYVNMFNYKNQAFKVCGLTEVWTPANQTETVAAWSRTNFSACLKDSVDDYYKVLEVHVKKIIYIRILGYCVSLLSLVTAILILCIPKLRCPRNYLHVNLFVVIMVRIILVITVDKIMRNNASQLLEMNELYGNLNIKSNLQCKIMIAIFRYSGSVYYVGIFSEALYLVLLLKYPYYDEKKSLVVCILVTWLLPLVWIIPWVCTKALIDNFWCWQTKSPYSLIIKVPHSMLLVANICSTVYILKILYSKIQSNTLSREKILRYRRLAKSLLILIPLFGLHFVLFAWLPYARVVKFNQDLEITTAYAETVMKSFQGFVVSIACCFMNFDVRAELILFICEKVKKMGCFKSCIDSDYINGLKYKQYSRHRSGPSSMLAKSGASGTATNLELDGKTRASDASYHSGSIASESQPMTTTKKAVGGAADSVMLLKQVDETSQLLAAVESGGPVRADGDVSGFVEDGERESSNGSSDSELPRT